MGNLRYKFAWLCQEQDYYRVVLQCARNLGYETGLFMNTVIPVITFTGSHIFVIGGEMVTEDLS